MKFLKKIKSEIRLWLPIVIIVLVGAFLRFYNLGWGLPYSFHPDERNMADAITRLSSLSLNPQFFAYGQFPLYLAYFSGRIFLWLTHSRTPDRLSFQQAIFALRLWSALFSSAAVYLVYLITRKILSLKKSFTFPLPLLAAAAAAFTPGLIQAAHFGTTESLLAFCFLAAIYLALKILEKPGLKNYICLGFVLGIALGSKISAVIFLAPLFLTSFLRFLKTKTLKEKLKTVLSTIFCLIVTLSFTLLFSPYLFLAYKDSRAILLYEISVAQGTSLPFYTRQFINTVPVIFQFQKIFPYTLGWPIFLLGLGGLILSLATLLRKIVGRPKLRLTDDYLLVIALSFIIYFFSQAFLFAKWTRFMAPIFPFFAVFTAYLLSNLNYPKKINFLITGVVIIPGIIFSSLYFRPDIRFVASEWIIKNIPSGTQVLYDTGNVIDIPVFPPNSPLWQYPNYHLRHTSFNFYDLDENNSLFDQLLSFLESSDFIFVPSRRIFINHLRMPQKFPKVARYYQLLFSGKLGYDKVAEFKILNDETAEETWSVFDHPVIRIYRKTIKYEKTEYEDLFNKK